MFGITNYRCYQVILLFMFLVNVNGMYTELKMVHVIFRHGQRTPTGTDSGERYPLDPYLNLTFFPEGHGSLTNEGKFSMYQLGTFLRRKYNHFLGDFYYPGVARVRTTMQARSMMSADLVNAGLWPPNEAQQWNKDLPWMPVPYEYVPGDTDTLMWSYKCPAYKAELERILQSDEVRKLVEPHLEFFAYLSEHTGSKITRTQQVFFLYHTLTAQVICNLTLPSWTEGYFPDGQMYDVTLLEYDISNQGDLLKRIYGGALLYDISKDYKKIVEGTSFGESSPKITLYSGHESNICSLLKALGLWTPHVPDFSAAIIFELYSNTRNSTNEFGIQILYYLGRSGKTIPLTLPGCTQICPVDKFTGLLSNVIPDDFDKLCGMTSQSSSVSLQSTLYITLQIWILLEMIPKW